MALKQHVMFLLLILITQSVCCVCFAKFEVLHFLQSKFEKLIKLRRVTENIFECVKYFMLS